MNIGGASQPHHIYFLYIYIIKMVNESDTRVPLKIFGNPYTNNK